MVIKPHHFMDIIKLLGGGIQVFVPDTDYGHDFYRAANGIIQNRQQQIKVTAGADDICRPCRFLGSDRKCTDCISHIKGISSKNSYNEMLDHRIMDMLGLCEDAVYTAEELCSMMGARPGLVMDVWKEEAEVYPDTAVKREQLFAAGVRKYLGLDKQSE
jgi:hypothetical protein